jgi:hypothetical protein
MAHRRILLFSWHLVGVHCDMAGGVDVERVLAVAFARALNQVVLEHVGGLVGTLQQLD